jgi:hypothetical protein
MHLFRLCASIALAYWFTCSSILAVAEEYARTIEVTGYGKVDAEPDFAVLKLGIVTESPKLQEAKAENDKRSKALLASLAKSKIPTKDIRTSHVQISPYRDDPEDFSSKYYHYKRVVRVVIRDLNGFEALFNDALEAGANTVSELRFDSSNRATLVKQARQKAIAHAREKASRIAEQFNQVVGKPHRITDESYYGGGGFGGGSGDMGFEEEDFGPTFATGPITVTASVGISFELNDPKP